MTNTQSPAPGADKLQEVEQTIAMVQQWHDGAEWASDDPELDRIDFSKIIAVLGDFRATLRPSAANAPVTAAIALAQQLTRASNNILTGSAGLGDSNACIAAADILTSRTAHPLPAQVQETEIEEILACLDDDAVTLLDENPEDEIAHNIKRAATLIESLIASRTPAPGMAGCVVTEEDVAAATKAYNVYDDGEQPMAMHAALKTYAQSHRGAAPHPSPALQVPADGLTEAEKLRNGNTALLDALMGMVNQFFYTDPDGVLRHSFMSAEEQAIEVLIQAGMAEEAEPGKNAYSLKWDALEARKPKQISWAEAVEQTITDPAEKARLLAFDAPEVATPGAGRGES